MVETGFKKDTGDSKIAGRVSSQTVAEEMYKKLSAKAYDAVKKVRETALRRAFIDDKKY